MTVDVGSVVSEGRPKAPLLLLPAPARRRPGARDMREAIGLARGLELERFRADAGWGIPELWLLEKPAIVCLFGARVSIQVLGSELIHLWGEMNTSLGRLKALKRLGSCDIAAAGCWTTRGEFVYPVWDTQSALGEVIDVFVGSGVEWSGVGW